MKWLKKFLGLCEHHWNIIDEIPVFDSPNAKRPFQTVYVMQCQHCGDIKKKVV